MKKYVYALAALALLASACKKPEEPVIPDTTPAQLLSFSILAADNDGLTADYAAEAITESMVIRIPGGGQDRTLVATLTAGENDEIKVNDKAVTNGKASFDATYPVDIVVTNTKSNKSAQYEVKIGKILQITSKELATIKSSGEMVYTSSSYAAGVNPSTGEMYLAYTFTPEGGVKNIGVVKYDGNAVVPVGTEGIVPAPESGSAIATSNVCSLGFDKDGTPYILYYSGDVKNSLSCRKFNGTDWTLVGEAGFSGKINTSWSTPTLYFDDSNHPGFAYTTSGYGSGVFYFDGTAWQAGEISGFPGYNKGGARGSNEGIFYGGSFGKMNGKQYGFFNANWFGTYVYELSGTSWSNALVQDFIPEGETTALPGNRTVVTAPDGKLLVMSALWSAQAMQLYKFDGTALTPYGAAFPIGISSSGNPDAARFGVNPVNGQILAVKLDPDDFPMYSVLTDDLQWEDFVYVGTTTQHPSEEDSSVIVVEHSIPAAYGGSMAFGFGKDGNAYVLWPDAARKDNGFHLWSIGLEEDILPE